MKEVVYISYIRFPSERAHAIYVAKVCESFIKIGLNCKLIVPMRFGIVKSRVQKYFNLQYDIPVLRFLSVDLFPFVFFKKIAHRTGLVSFAFFLLPYVILGVRRDTVIFTNDVFLAFIISFFHKKIIWEVHDYPDKITFLYKKTVKRSWKIITNNFYKKNELIEDFNVDKKKILAQHNGVSLRELDINITKKRARNKLNLSLDKKMILYTGSLQVRKGVYLLAEVAKQNKNFNFYFVGGSKKSVNKFKNVFNKFKNINVIPSVPHEDIIVWQRAADVLVLPNTGKDKISKYFTSPMKLFEYMASKRPIVASDLPSITEILNKKTCVLVQPDSSQELIAGIKLALSDDDLVLKITENAFKKVKKYDWKKRARNTCDFLFIV